MPFDENSVILVSDRRTVKRFDLTQRPDVVGLPGEQGPAGERSAAASSEPPKACSSCTMAGSLIRLDPATGEKRWETLPGIEDLSERPGSIAFDRKNLYCVNFENFANKTCGRRCAPSRL